MASNVLAGEFTGTGNSPAFDPKGLPFALSLLGTIDGSVTLEFTVDNGDNWVSAVSDILGTAATFTTPGRWVIEDPEVGVKYRLSCTTLTSGESEYRLSQ